MTDPTPVRAKRGIERGIEFFLFSARWLMAPFYVGLVFALFLVLLVFGREVATDVAGLAELTESSAVLMALSLIDLSLTANLLLIVIFAGYENFVSRIDVVNAERPEWMGQVDFSGLKMKLIGSIVAISAVALLRAFMQIAEGGPIVDRALAWQVGLRLTFLASGLILALMDRMSGGSHEP